MLRPVGVSGGGQRGAGMGLEMAHGYGGDSDGVV